MTYRVSLLMLVATLLGVTGARSGSANTGGADEEWPYRFIMAGPATAAGGDQVAYRLTYTNVHPERRGGPGFVFTFSRDHASFGSSSVVNGPGGRMTITRDEHTEYVWWDFSSAPPSGAVRLVLRIHGDFTGVLAASMYVPGTAIHLPPDSVTSVKTTVRDEWPYRFVVSGPTTAASGDQIAYRITYTKLHRFRIESPAFVFGWDGKGARFIASKVLAGPAGVLTPGFGVDLIRWDFSGARSGVVRVGLRVKKGFTGTLTVGMYVPGTAIHLPPDSVTSASTRVTAP